VRLLDDREPGLKRSGAGVCGLELSLERGVVLAGLGVERRVAGQIAHVEPRVVVELERDVERHLDREPLVVPEEAGGAHVETLG
jgi:hypothetical protein